MIKYQEILSRILTEGVEKKPVRMENGKAIPVDDGVSTLCVANIFFEHDLQDGQSFPLLTLKAMPWKSIRVELEGFIKGVTSKKWFEARGCSFWSSFCNPTVIQREESYYEWFNNAESPSKETIKQWKKEEDDLGPLGYSHQWRRFNQAYDEDDCGWVPTLNPELADKADQLKRVVNTLHTNYNDRRMHCSAWNPLQIDSMALPPCHLSWTLCTTGDRLNLAWKQRSCDTLRGVPANISSYSLLLMLLAKEAGLKAGKVGGLFIDCHLYEDQIPAAEELLARQPYPLPSVSIPTLHSGKSYSIFDWTYNDVMTSNRKCHPKLKNMGKLVV